MIEDVPITTMGPLGKCLNDEYNHEQWEKFCSDFDFHKLTYKIPLQEATPEGKKPSMGTLWKIIFLRLHENNISVRISLTQIASLEISSLMTRFGLKQP